MGLRNLLRGFFSKLLYHYCAIAPFATVRNRRLTNFKARFIVCNRPIWYHDDSENDRQPTRSGRGLQ